MITYLIQVSVALILFYGIYALFLKQETSFGLARFYLIFALLASVILPVIDTDSLVSLFLTQADSDFEYWLPDITTRSVQVAEKEAPDIMMNLLVTVYLIGVGISTLRLLISFVKLQRIIRRSKMKKDKEGWYYLLEEGKGSFSFFKYVFIGNRLSHSGEDRQSILMHERMHAKHWHSVDVMLVQLIGILVWFNPVIYWYRNILEQVHEYEADLIASRDKAEDYCELLVKDVLESAHFSLANHFNKSLTLKRISMIKSMKRKMAGRKKLALIGAALLIVVVMACEEKVMSDMRRAAGQSVLLTEYPVEVQQAVKEIKLKNPKAELQVYGVVKTQDLENIDMHGKTATMFFRDNDPDYKLYVILGADDMKLAASNLFEDKDGERIFTIVEEPAQPKNGMAEFYKFIGENMRYPQRARSTGVEGRVFVKFLVDENGKLSDFQVLRGIGGGCDEEALRVLSLSPPWNPGKQRGMTVKSTFNMAVIFKLENEQGTTSHKTDFIEVPTSDFGKSLPDVVVSALYSNMDVQIEKSMVGGATYLSDTIRRKLDDSPLPGVNVVFKGRTDGAVTDSNGKFKVKAPVSNGSIIISFIGFKSEEFTF